MENKCSEDISEKLNDFIKEKGGELVNIASVQNYTEIFSIGMNTDKHPEKYIDNAKSIIVIGIKMIDGLMDHLTGKSDMHGVNLRNYLMHYNYDQLDFIAIQTSRFIENLGYDAYPIQARSESRTNGVLTGYFPLKLAAVAAGLGIQGKSSLVITPEFGPRVRLVAIVTDMDLKESEPRKGKPGDLCGKCRICIEACPVDALDFDENKKVPIIDKLKCQKHMDYCQCALCQAVCPWGKMNAKKRRIQKL